MSKPKNPKGLTDEYCCQVLAWIHAYGGTPENKVLLTQNAELMEDLDYAQKLMRIYHPVGANKKLIPVLHKYMDETRGYLEKKEHTVPDWAKSICEKYGVDLPPVNADVVLKVKRTRQRTT